MTSNTLTARALQIPLLGVAAFLLARQSLCIAGGLTTAELLQRRRHAYLTGQGGGFSNPFDRGVVANCLQFWSARRPDWGSELQQEQEVRGMARSRA